MSEAQAPFGELHAADVDGNRIREYDDVALLEDIQPAAPGNVAADVVRAGTIGTVILIFEDGSFELECDLGAGAFAFAAPSTNVVRIARRREEKLTRC